VDNKNLTLFNRIKDSDIYFSFIKSPTAVLSTLILIIIFFCSFFVELVTPYNPFDPSSLSLMDAFTPPSWTEEGLAKFILGTTMAFTHQYRFAAAESVEKEKAPKAISSLLLAGIVAAFLGISLSNYTKNFVSDYLYVGSYLTLAILTLIPSFLLFFF